MKVQICGVAVEVELTGLQKRMLAAGNSVTVNLYPDPDHREYTVKDMGFTSPRRVHVDSVKHPNPAVDDKRLADALRGGFHYKGAAIDLNVGSEYDIISRPSHYTEGRKYEPKDVIRDWGLNFNLGSAVKYLSRAGRKDAMINDLEKAKTFIQFEIEALAEEGEEEE